MKSTTLHRISSSQAFLNGGGKGEKGYFLYSRVEWKKQGWNLDVSFFKTRQPKREGNAYFSQIFAIPHKDVSKEKVEEIITRAKAGFQRKKGLDWFPFVELMNVAHIVSLCENPSGK